MDLESTLGDADATILDGGSQGSVSVWGANYNTQVSDVTIQNGVAAYNEDGNGEYGGGVLCLGYQPDAAEPIWMSPQPIFGSWV